nr:PREDICTED: uncharacterized protein LOC108951214 [Musa acuminata subsp. malaccensis]
MVAEHRLMITQQGHTTYEGRRIRQGNQWWSSWHMKTEDSPPRDTNPKSKLNPAEPVIQIPGAPPIRRRPAEPGEDAQGHGPSGTTPCSGRHSGHRNKQRRARRERGQLGRWVTEKGAIVVLALRRRVGVWPFGGALGSPKRLENGEPLHSL